MNAKKLDKMNLLLQVVSVVLVLTFLYMFSMNAMLLTSDGENMVMCMMSSSYWELPKVECMRIPSDIESATLYPPQGE